jgi:hypothetical protein
MGLEQVELVMDAEDEFGIKIDSLDDYGQSVMTVGAFYDLVLRLVRELPRSELARRPDLESHVWNRVAVLAAKHGYDLKPEQITRETRFIEDLGYG